MYICALEKLLWMMTLGLSKLNVLPIEESRASLSLNIINNSASANFSVEQKRTRDAVRRVEKQSRLWASTALSSPSEAQDEREIQLRVQLAHVGDNNDACAHTEKMLTPLLVPLP